VSESVPTRGSQLMCPITRALLWVDVIAKVVTCRAFRPSYPINHCFPRQEGWLIAWFRCPCGHVAEVIPRDGYEIASVSHLHARARVAGGSEPVRMQEVPAPALAPTPEPEFAAA
jgi:hypothetical protein